MIYLKHTFFIFILVLLDRGEHPLFLSLGLIHAALKRYSWHDWTPKPLRLGIVRAAIKRQSRRGKACPWLWSDACDL